MNQACCTLPPVIATYDNPKGTVSSVGDLPIYSVGPSDATCAVILCYDIFGLSAQAKQVADVLAGELGARVVMPDWFRGKPWLLENYPPKDSGEFMSWLQTAGSWDSVVKPGVEAVVEQLKTEGVTKYAAVGFCWGAKMASQASRLPGFVAVGCVHYAFLEAADMEASPVPVALLPSKDEADEAPLVEPLKSKPFWEQCLVQRFSDMHHGWVAARGDWSVPEQAKRATEALQLLAGFFKRAFAA